VENILEAIIGFPLCVIVKIMLENIQNCFSCSTVKLLSHWYALEQSVVSITHRWTVKVGGNFEQLLME